MNDDESGRLFRGNELSRLLVLLAIAVGGWTAVWYYVFHSSDEPDEPELVVEAKPSPIVPDRSPAFETVTDKTAVSFRDMAAYDRLLQESREATPAGLAARARRDVTYAHLWRDPADYRGVPVHILGTARRVLRYESSLSKTGWLYEAWVVLPDLPKNPYVCVFEDAPEGFPVGPDVSQRVVFNGYFLKLMRYQASDTERGAPLFIGRIGWTPRPAEHGTSIPSTYWLAGAVALMFLVSLGRWVFYLRRSLSPRRRTSILVSRANEEIDPEALASLLENVEDDATEPRNEPPQPLSD